jgi:uncharacterized protein with beta-barrel porin domain
VQGSTFHVPGFVETTGFGGAGAASLVVSARDQAQVRGELGARLDGRLTLGTMPLDLFVRAAWAFYGARDASFSASFLGLPGSQFAIQGAQLDTSTALISAGLDLRITPDVALSARFDGEYGATTVRSAGTARLRIAF